MAGKLFKRFVDSAKKHADNSAIIFNAKKISYQEIYKDVLALIEFINKDIGISAEFIGVALTPSDLYVTTILSVNGSNNTFMPLGEAYPSERTASIIKITNTRVLIRDVKKPLFADISVKPNLSHIFTLPSGKQLKIDILENEKIAKNNNDACYLLSTSGSTGKPKLIIGSEAGLLNFTDWQINEFSLGSNSVGTFLSPITFDVSLRDIFTPLFSGGSINIPDSGVNRDPAKLYSWLQSNEITLMHIVPTIFRNIISLLYANKGNDLKLDYIFLAGEPLLLEDVRQWQNLNKKTQLINLYGPSETSLAKFYHRVKHHETYTDAVIPLGKPISDAQYAILVKDELNVNKDDIGELVIKTKFASLGYINDADKQQENFSFEDGYTCYKTGDLVNADKQGRLNFKGRIDFQVKLRGQRVELLEVDNAIKALTKLNNVVSVISIKNNEQKLISYLETDKQYKTDELRKKLLKSLPDYMVPSIIVCLNNLPLNANGKLDRKKLPAPIKQRPNLSVLYQKAVTSLEKEFVGIWEEILNLEGIGIHDNFFDLGGTSNQVVNLVDLTNNFLKKNKQKSVTIADVFASGSIKGLITIITKDNVKAVSAKRKNSKNSNHEIAIIGMALNVPEANDIDTFWQNLLDAKESIRTFSNDELDSEISLSLKAQANYIAARGVIDDVWEFDNEYFNLTKKETEILDPQQRLLIKLSEKAFQDSAIIKNEYEGLIGVFAGVGDNDYYHKVLRNSDAINTLGDHALRLANEKDYVALRIAHVLNLQGMAISVHTACSTSLVAVAQAVEALRANKVDMALAGGAYIPFPQNSGYQYVEGGFASSDGHCRPFDKKASGTVFSSGGGMVLLKRKDDAVADNDRIYATINGIGVNNDGGGKMSFMSPSAHGQARVIQTANDDAGIDPQQVDYIETHGTATPLGDPIEVEGLSQVYTKKINGANYRLGAVKSNIGHLDAAAGVIGLIKASLVLKKQMYVPTLHFTEANPAIKFDEVGMQVCSQSEKPVKKSIDYAGVSAFGVGGTNAHIILQATHSEISSQEDNRKSGQCNLYFSAKNVWQLDEMTNDIRHFISNHPEVNIQDIADTLALGREKFEKRRFVVCKNSQDAISKLSRLPLASTDTHEFVAGKKGKLVLLFPGQGSQHINMGKSLYMNDSVFRHAFDEAAIELLKYNEIDIRKIIYPETEEEYHLAETKINETRYSQQALFVVGYALVIYWQTKGVKVDIVVGHSIGEYLAAYVAGIFNLQDALWLVSERGRLMQQMPRGGMISVALNEDSVKKYISNNIHIAAVNAKNKTVIAGLNADLDKLQDVFEKDNIEMHRLQTSHAFHTSMMEPMLADFRKSFAKVAFNKPKIEIISTMTGNYANDKHMTSVDYWLEQIISPVRFANAMQCLWKTDNVICLECGPLATASTLARNEIINHDDQGAYPSLGKINGQLSEEDNLHFAIGQLWLRDLLPKRPHHKYEKVNLPTYPFDKTEYRLDVDVIEKQDDIPEVLSSVQDVIKELSNMLVDITQFDHAKIEQVSFIEAGLDSLGLTQFSLAIQRKYNVPISLSQLLNEFSNSELLGEHIYCELANDNELEVAYKFQNSDKFIGMQVPENLPNEVKVGIDTAGDPHWYKSDPNDKKMYIKLEF